MNRKLMCSKNIYLLFLLFILFVGNTKAQEYIFEYDMNFAWTGTKAYGWDLWYKTNNGKETHFDDAHQVSGSYRVSGEIKIPLSEGVITQIKATGVMRRAGKGGSRECGSKKGNTYLFFENYTTRSWDFRENLLDKNFYQCWEKYMSYLNVPYFRFYPNIVLTKADPDQNDLSLNKVFGINATSGFPSDYYDWEYVVTSSSSGNNLQWVKVPSNSFSGAKLSTTLKNILGDNIDSYIGKNILFRINHGNNLASGYVMYSIKPEAPKIVSATANSTLCSDSETGSIEVTIERELLNGEILEFFIDKTGSDLINNTKIDYRKTSTPKVYEIQGLGKGTYTVKISTIYNGTHTDNETKGHVKSDITINDPRPMIYSVRPLDINNVSCYKGNDGSFKVSVTNGTAPYTIKYRGSEVGNDSEKSVAGLTVAGLIADTYEYYVVDANDCSLEGDAAFKEVSISQPEAGLSIDFIEAVDPKGNGRSDGHIKVAISGGTAPYTVEWKDKESNTVITSVRNNTKNGVQESELYNIPAGTYCLRVTDRQGCEVSSLKDYILYEPNAIRASIKESSSILCNGDKTGSLQVYDLSGGIPYKTGDPYKFEWSKKHIDGKYWRVDVTAKSEIKNLVAGAYRVIISDSSIPANTKTLEYTITEPPILTAAITKHDVSCKGLASGRINFVISGGVAPYTIYYKKDSDATYLTKAVPTSTDNISNLPADNYICYVKDKNGCTAKIGSDLSTKVTINEPDEVLVVTSKSLIGTSGSNRSDGSVTVKITGGVPFQNELKYDISWYNTFGSKITSQTDIDEDGNILSKIENLTQGIYLLKVIDDNALPCIKTFSFNVTDPQPISISLSETKTVDCAGHSTAELTAKVTGGVPYSSGSSYTYKWYKMEGPDSIRVNNENDSILTRVGVGLYQVFIEDSSIPANTKLSSVYEVKQPDPLETTIAHISDVSCFSGSDGQIHISIKGGVGDYKLYYQHDSIGNEYNELAVILPENKFYMNNLRSGVYNIYIKDRNGCYASVNGKDTAQIVLKQPEKPLGVSTQKITSPSGFGRSDGRIYLVIDGGTPFDGDSKYQIVWKDQDENIILSTDTITSENLFSTEIQNLSKGKYKIYIEDKNSNGYKNGCYLSATVNLTEPLPLKVNLENRKMVSCFGDNTGELVAHVTGGVPYITNSPYHYKWYRVESDNDLLLEEQTDSVLTNINAGTYKVQISDGSVIVNTVESLISEITQPSQMVVDIKTHAVSCFGGNDGFIHATVIGGVGNHKLYYKKNDSDVEYGEIAIDETDKTFKLDKIYGGNYSIYIQDENLCYAPINNKNIEIITIEEPLKALSIHSEEILDPTAYDIENGKISVTLNGGTLFSDNSYKVVWRNSNNEIIKSNAVFLNGVYSSTVSDLAEGKYSIEVTDANYMNTDGTINNRACILIKEYELVKPKEMKLILEETHYVSCNKMSDGQLSATVTGGIPNKESAESSYKYTWYKQKEGVFVVIPAQDDNILTGISEGIYKVDVEDYARIPNKQSSTYQINQPDQLIAISQDVNILCGETATISVKVSGGTQPYIYKWNTGDNTPQIENLVAGKYMVIVTDARGCETTVVAKVITPSDLSVSGKVNHPVCYQAANGSIITQIVGGVSPYYYQWNTGETTKDIINIGGGIYSLTVTDQTGCSYSESFELIDPTAAKINLGEDRTLCLGQSYTLEPEVEDPKTTFYWTGPNNFKSTSSKVELDRAGKYSLVITDSKGCQATDDIEIFMTDYGISSEMVVATDVFVNDTIVLVNISYPEPDKIDWIFSDEDPVEIIEKTAEYAKIIFKQIGDYSVGMRSYVKDCFQDVVKTLRITESNGGGDDNFGVADVTEFKVYPNPNNGQFKVKIGLARVSTIRMRLFSLQKGGVSDDRTLQGSNLYEIDYNKQLSPGTHILLLETASGRRSEKILVR